MKALISIVLISFATNVIAQLNWEKNFAMTTSGGVSLGSYKAGFLYYIDQFQNLNGMSENDRVDQLTGASAGAINSLIAGINSCQKKPQKRIESLYWKVWSKASFWDLYKPLDVTAKSIISHRNFSEIMTDVFIQLKQGLPKNCEFIMGVTVTHDKNSPYKINKNIQIPNIKNYIVLKIQGNGRGVPPQISNFLLKDKFPRQLLLPFSGLYANDEKHLKNSILASASFPIAFSPMQLKVCERSSLNNIKTCAKKDAKSLSFIDGGLLDNAPLLLNYRISQTRKIKHNYFYLNASNFNFPSPSDVPTSEGDKVISAQNLVKKYFSLFIQSSRNQELLNFFEQYGGTRRNTIVTKTSLPPISTPMYAFFGFLDESFREFDFTLGMADARRMLKGIESNELLKSSTYPENKIENSWTLFHCISSIIKEDPISEKQCIDNKEKLTKDQMIILQVSLNRVFDLCQKIEDKSLYGLCQRLEDIKSPDLIIKEKVISDFWSQAHEESEERYILRQLKHYNYAYNDLNQKLNKSTLGAEKRIYYYFKDVLKNFEQKQHEEKRASISFVNGLALDQIGNAPLENATYLFIGNQIEIGKSHNFTRYKLPESLSFEYSAYIDNYNDWPGNTDNKLTITPTIGFTFTPAKFGKYLNLSISTQIGYQFSKEDKFGTRSCHLDAFDLHPSYCSSLKGYTHLLFTIWKRLSIKLGAGTTLRKYKKKRPYEGNLLFGFAF